MNYTKMAADARKKNMAENMTPLYVEWKVESQTIVGAFRNSVEVESSQNKGTYKQYMFDTDEGLVKFHLGKATDAEAGDMFIGGHVYAIEYEGQLKISGGKSVNKFHIEHILND